METTTPTIDRKPPRIKWYRSPVPREELAKLNKRSDFLGFLQAGGYLGLLALTGTAAVMSVGRVPWYVSIFIFLFHGMCYNFLINGFHELVHDSVFKTKWLNRVFLWIHSFLGWYNHIHFWASHTEHHKYTLHVPDDREVVLPQRFNRKAFMKSMLFSPGGLWYTIKYFARHSAGRLEGGWEIYLFTELRPDLKSKMLNWSRFVLFGHVAMTTVCFATGNWFIPVVITFGRFYGAGIHTLCNSSQHIGLTDSAADFRLCCRTIYLNPFFQFLYWHMNYHTEHHMYAAVPCYRLPRLHRLIKDDLPHCPNGLVETWTHIGEVLRKQEEDPSYQFIADVPTPSPASEALRAGKPAQTHQSSS